MSCMRACPTAAVRIRRERAVKLADRCIDCGECIKVCPRGAIVPLTDHLADLSKFSYRVAIPSPALYAQFDPEMSPQVVSQALKQCGFDDVEGFSAACDAITMAMEFYLGEHRGQYPLISSFCPTVVRLIQVKYPDLVEQLLPVLAPREVAARNAKKRISESTGMPPDRIGAVYITSCPAKMVAILEHPGVEKSYLDTAVSISDLFQTLAAAVSAVSAAGDNGTNGETATGLSWAYMGGLPHSLPAENTIAVAGLPNVIRILDDIEKGRLRKYSFIDCHACPEGCVGGCLSVEDPYVARAKAIRISKDLPPGPAADRQEVEQLYREGYYFMDEPLASRPLRPLDADIARAIAKMKERDRISNGLPGIDCGACGSPSCRAFAEDVVQGEAEQASCVFFHQRELADRIENLGQLVKMQHYRHGGQS
jgi:Fe-S-cluster-containing hydrogenase component 2